MRRLKVLFLVFVLIFTSMVPMLPMSVTMAEETGNSTVFAAGSPNDDWLHVEGNKIVDMNGREVWLTGANWFGYNTGTNVFDGVWSANMKAALKSMADRGINFLRIPMSTQIIYEWMNGIYPKANVNTYTNPELVGKNSLEIFDFAVQSCKEVGMKIMIDIHSPASEAMGHIYPLWYDDTYTTEIWISTQEWLANRYKNDDTILAFDIENEPHGKPGEAKMAKWDNSTDLNNWKHAAETCAKRILAVNPNLLIMVEGIEVYPKPGYDYTAVDEYGKESKYYFNWWGGNLRGVKDLPLNLGAHQDQLVYSPHDYGPLVWRQPWFYAGFTKETLYNDVWRDNWAFIHEQKIAPLLVGEWGGFMDGGDNQKWMTALRDYMIENKISHTFWCFNANSGDTGGLVLHDFMTWDEEKYALLKPALWQNASGKFIGIDHQIPLGSNGITVTQYYGGTVPSIQPSPSVRPTPTATTSVRPTATPTPTIPSQNPTPTTTSTGSMSFPYNAKYPFGQSTLASDQNTANQLLKAEWEDWKSTHITTSGAGGFKRVQRDAATNYDTVSEGMGYGMLLSVYFGEQALFDDLYGYVKKYFNTNGVMSWHIDANGNITTSDGGVGAATDADEDIAVALVFASKKWGSSSKYNYGNEARTLIGNMYNKMVEPGTYVLKPGDMWGGSTVTNPSYFAPAWYRIFADFTGNTGWINVANKGYEIVKKASQYNNNTGLVPDWCTAEGTKATNMGYDFKYDAVRYHWRAAIDYSWFGTPQAKQDCDALSAFYKNIGIANIKDGYTITGTLLGQWHSPSFVSMAATAAMTGTDMTYGSGIYNENIKVKDSGDYTYYGNSLRLMALLYTTGNFPNLYNYTPTQPSPSPSNPPQGLVGDVSGDGTINSTDYTLMKRYVLKIINDFPAVEDDLWAGDLNGDGLINSTDLTLLKRYILRIIDKFPKQ